jgi:microcystin-dependent protein
LSLFDGKRRGKNKSGLFDAANRGFDYDSHDDQHQPAAPANQQVPPGCVTMFAGGKAQVPSGWLLCDGTAVSRSQYAALFEAVSTLFGTGDGSTTFNVPDFRNRFQLVHGSFKTLGQTGGATDHTHGVGTYDVTNAAGHTHGVNGTSAASAGHEHAAGGLVNGNPDATGDQEAASGAESFASGGHGHNISGNTGTAGSHSHTEGTFAATTGGSHSHSVTADTSSGSANPPYLACHYIIKT